MTEREQFEAWMRDTHGPGVSLVRSDDGYISTVPHRAVRMTYASVQMLWEAWQARAQTAQAVPSDVVRGAERWLWMWNHAQNVSFSYSSRPYEITTVTKLHCGSLKDTIDAAIAQQKGQP